MEILNMDGVINDLMKATNIDPGDLYTVIAEGGVKISRKRYDQLIRVVEARKPNDIEDLSLADLLKLTQYVSDVAPFFTSDRILENASSAFHGLRSHCARRVL